MIVLQPWLIAEFINVCPSKFSPIIATKPLLTFASLLSMTISAIVSEGSPHTSLPSLAITKK